LLNKAPQKKTVMKKTIGFVLFVLPAIWMSGQPSYGKHIYPHQGTECSTGALGKQSPGFLLAGYAPVTLPGQPNFYIDRTDVNGKFSASPFEFQNDYYASGRTDSCFTAWNVNQIPNCYGVSVIEIPNGEYHCTGATQYGAFFTNLYSNGTVQNALLYKFKGNPKNISKPLIAWSNVHNETYIAGSYDDTLYIFRVDYFGFPNKTYACYLTNSYYGGLSITPRAIIESPYGSKDLLIVGEIDNGQDKDALFFQIDNNLTAPVNIMAQDLQGNPNPNTEYLSITAADPANSTNAGFLLGGNSDVAGSAQAWMCKLDPSGNLIWSKIIKGNFATVNSSVTGVSERYSAANGMFEAYGAAHSPQGIVTYKLDDNGGIPVSLVTGGRDEFHYNDGSTTITRPVAMTFNNNGAPSDEGLHVYGNSEITQGGHYLVESYFSGEGGCNNIISTIQTAQTYTMWAYYPVPNSISPPSYCNFSVTATPNSSYKVGCAPVPSLPLPASNNRVTSIQSQEYQPNSFVISPNPSSSQFRLACSSLDFGSLKITDLLGKECHFDYKPINNSNTEVMVQPHNWAPGVYFINFISAGRTNSAKIIYN
jgi:hypothetical protein